MDSAEKVDSDAVEGSEQRPVKKVKLSQPEVMGEAESNIPHCIVCMESDSDDSPLEVHQCSQCSKDAWKVCVCCNEALLSRTCPVCRGEYAPIVMHPMPGLPLKRLADRTISSDERATLLYKFGVVRQLVPKSNVAVFVPSTSSMHLTLPQKLTEHADDAQLMVVTCSISFSTAQLDDGRFLFNNRVWDEIENTIENGAVQAGEMMNLAQATQWLLSFTKHDDTTVFTMMTPADWSYMLDPGESPDINDALKAIRESIVASIKLPASVPAPAPASVPAPAPAPAPAAAENQNPELAPEQAES